MTPLTPVAAYNIVTRSEEHYVLLDCRRMEDLVIQIQAWAIERNITAAGGATALSQMKKLREEVEELGEGLVEDDRVKVVDGVGDALVVLIQICRLYGLTLDECLEHAYHEIKDRKGKMINGVFVKEIT